MKQQDWQLINGVTVEAIPAVLAKGRGNETRRLLSQHDWLLRRKPDGRFLAVSTNNHFLLLLRDAKSKQDCENFLAASHFSEKQSLQSVRSLLDLLGVDTQYGLRHQLALIPEPSTLAFSGLDRYQRPLWMDQQASVAWQKMQRIAVDEGIHLQAISGYRGHAYQMGIFRRKLARGQSLEQILEVNAAPGYSEHHSGRAIDIGTPGEPPAEESFENTEAFAWLMQHAGDFGFRLSYPRDNPHGIIYEPWHWYHL